MYLIFFSYFPPPEPQVSEAEAKRAAQHTQVQVYERVGRCASVSGLSACACARVAFEMFATPKQWRPDIYIHTYIYMYAYVCVVFTYISARHMSTRPAKAFIAVPWLLAKFLTIYLLIAQYKFA